MQFQKLLCACFIKALSHFLKPRFLFGSFSWLLIQSFLLIPCPHPYLKQKNDNKISMINI